MMDMDASLYMALGFVLALTAVAVVGGLFLARLRRHLQHNLKDAIGQQMGLSRRMTDIIIQLQQNQAKQDEQLQKLAEFTLVLKKDMSLLATTVAEQEADNIAASEPRPKYLN